MVGVSGALLRVESVAYRRAALTQQCTLRVPLLVPRGEALLKRRRVRGRRLCWLTQFGPSIKQVLLNEVALCSGELLVRKRKHAGALVGVSAQPALVAFGEMSTCFGDWFHLI